MMLLVLVILKCMNDPTAHLWSHVDASAASLARARPPGASSLQSKLPRERFATSMTLASPFSFSVPEWSHTPHIFVRS